MASRLTEAQKTLKTLAAGAKKEGRIFLALIALAVVGRRASSTFRFFVMAGLVQDKPGHDGRVRVFPNHSDRLGTHS
jgi:hypothetical protein